MYWRVTIFAVTDTSYDYYIVIVVRCERRTFCYDRSLTNTVVALTKITS